MRFWVFLFSVLALGARGVDLNEGLAMFYNFDDVSGPVLHDAGSSHSTGKISNAKPDAHGVRGGCMHFGGERSYVEVDRNPTKSPKHTVSLWFKPDSIQQVELNNMQLISMNRRYQLSFQSNGPHFRFYTHCLNATSYGYGALRADSGVFDLAPDRWYHVAMVVDGGVGFYLNGRPLGYITGPGANAGDLQLLIGALNNDPSAGPRYSFPGFIDEVRIYDRALADDEINALFRQDAPKELLPAAPVSLGPSYVVKNGRFFLRTEKNGMIEERELSDAETAALLGRAGATGEAAKESTTVCEIGFSNNPKGDQDVTIFLPGETLNVRVHDVDLPSANTNLSVQIFLTQTNAAEVASAPRLLRQLDRARDGSFRGAIALTNFIPGSVFASVVATDASGQPMLMRASRLEILAGPETATPAP